MLERVITITLLIVSLIHLLPVTGVLGANKLSLLYSVNVSDPNLEILMRHRAILFGILGALFAYAAFRPELQLIAFVVGFASVLSFFYLSYTVGGFNEALRKVVIADIVALLALLVGSSLYYVQASR
jgi:hypothetical protein